MDNIIYDDIKALVELYRNGDLPVDQMAFPYYESAKKVSWVHIDSLKNMVVMESVYPTSNNKKNTI